MVLQWKLRDTREAVPMRDRKVTALKDEHLVIGYHGWAFAQFGVFQIDVCPNDRKYQNGTKLYKVWLHCKEASSSEMITLTKIRGDLGMALQAAEKFLFAKEYNMPNNPTKENYLKLKAVDIEWDTEDEDVDERDLNLPTEIEIPEEVLQSYKENEDAISDYLSDQTGFCHKGFRLVNAEGNEVDIDA